MPTYLDVVVDASVSVWQVLGSPFADKIDTLWKSWVQEGIKVCAPQLWLNEVTSAIHKVCMKKQVSEKNAREALEAVLSLGIELYDQDIDLCRKAFDWATKLNHLAAYDSFYVALAQRLNAELWTADESLYKRSNQIGVTCVRWIGE